MAYYSFVSSNSGGTWYNMVGGAVNLFNENFDGAQFSIEASGGSVENVRRIVTGEADFGMAYASHVYESVKGIGSYKGQPSDNLQIISELYKSPHYFVTLKDSGIKSLSDLEGKTVAIGTAGSGTSDNSRRTFEALSIRVNEVEMAFADQARALQDGQIAALGQGGAPAAGIVELAAAREIFIIPFSEEELKTIVALAPYFEPGELPANTYEGQTEAVPTFSFSVYWTVNKNVPERVVYECLRLADSKEGLEYLTIVHKQWETLSYNEEGVKLLESTYHPGALAYWKR
jgi:TRAP transporter TAXI family solute receptor